MNEENENLDRGYRRAASGLCIVAIGWILAILFGRRPDDSPFVWAIPIAAALLSTVFYSQSRKIGNSQTRNIGNSQE
ncbi:MAG: hypothetical protein ACOYLN_00315 [Blastocatellia bacterium]|jgi:hypothetical protein